MEVFSPKQAADYSILEGERDDDTLVRVYGRFEPNTSYSRFSGASEEHGEIVFIGIPRDPDDFVRKAVKVGNSRNALLEARRGVAKEIAKRVVMPLDERSKLASSSLEKWKLHEAQSASDNQKLLASQPEYLRTVLGRKNVLLWKKVLEDCNFPDSQLWSDLRQGFRITGWMRQTGLFAHLLRPPSMTLQELLSQASYRTPLTLSGMRNSDPDETDIAAWKETLEEEARGWIFRDPHYKANDIILANRFGLKQKEKIRVIDNGKSCGLNQACGLPEKFTLHGVDTIAGILLEAMALAGAQGLKLVGKTYDLVSAYKFFRLHPQDRQHFRIAVKDTDSGSIAVFGSNVLTFGATGSVAAFLRCSAGIWQAGVHGVGMPGRRTLTTTPLSSQVDACADSLFDLLGVEYAKTGKKAVAFSTVCKGLGLCFDLSKSAEGEVTIRQRQQELTESLDAILAAGQLSCKDAESLRGRLHWYSSYLFRRGPCEAMHKLGRRASYADRGHDLDRELRWALQELRSHISSAPPLVLRTTTGRTMLVFTDRSYEPTSDNPAGIGGAAYDDQGMPVRFCSDFIPENVLLKLGGDSDHPIYEIEIYALAMAVRLWQDLLENSYTVFYIDNSAAQGALISGSSSTPTGRKLLQQIGDFERAMRCRPRYGRVASHSNPSDAPSRGEFRHPEKEGAQRSQAQG